MIDELLKELKKQNKKMYIQTHDFPDPDAISSAFGLQTFLGLYNLDAHIVYSGEIQRDALKTMIQRLNIKAYNTSEVEIVPNDLIIIVDGCKGSKNVTDLPGFEIAVIDHHIVDEPDDVPFIEIKDKIGACSTIITEYFSNNSMSIPKECATALMVGISRDTDLLTRKVTENDIEAYHYLYKYADNAIVNSILRNNIQLSDFEYFSKSIKELKTNKSIAWLYFENGCDTNLLGILGDFILSAQEIKFSILFAKNKNSITVSIRNENERWNGAEIARVITSGIGAGGGHREMAGGIIFKSEDFNLEETMNQIMSNLYD